MDDAYVCDIHVQQDNIYIPSLSTQFTVPVNLFRLLFSKSFHPKFYARIICFLIKQSIKFLIE